MNRNRRLRVRLGCLLMGAASTVLCACREAPSDRTGGSTEHSAQQQAWDAIGAGAVVVDVRTPAEFAREHLPQAINIPYREIARRLPAAQPDTAATIVLYCHSGRRSGIAARQLRKLGYTNLINGGGLAQLQRARPGPVPEE